MTQNDEILSHFVSQESYFICTILQKVNIDFEKEAQIDILANKIVTKWCPNIIIKESKKTIHYSYFIFSCYV